MSYILSHHHLTDIAQGCRDESRQSRGSEKGYCFELFRRAIDAQDGAAWEAIQRQYQYIVMEWLYIASHHSLNEDEIADLFQETFTKFWQTLRKRAVPLAKHFDHVGVLLKYLRQCTITSVLDFHRQSQRRVHLHKQLVSEAAHGDTATLAEQTLEYLTHQQTVQQVSLWIQTQVTDVLEKLVLQLSFEQDLSPKDIAARHPDKFESVHDVRRIKERVLKRARRALEPVS